MVTLMVKEEDVRNTDLARTVSAVALLDAPVDHREGRTGRVLPDLNIRGADAASVAYPYASPSNVTMKKSLLG